MSLQREAGCMVQNLGEGIHQLPHGTEVLAVPVAKVHQAETGEREGIRLPPQETAGEEEQVLGADWLVRWREVACCFLQERLEGWVLHYGLQGEHGD